MRNVFLFLFLACPAFAQVTDDSDLSGKPPSAAALDLIEQEGRAEENRRVFPLKTVLSFETIVLPQPGRISAALAFVKGAIGPLPARLARAKLVGPGTEEAWLPLDGQGRLTFVAPAGLSGSYRLRFSLDNSYWIFRDREGAAYEWESPAFSLPAPSGVDLGTLTPEAGSQNAKLGVLHLTYLKALDFLARQEGLGWWDQALTVNWPGSADYFSAWTFSLELTQAEHWDVVLHELGHAVMHKAMKARMAGGSHKIDECYTPALAWSEGWASFFAAAVALDRDDRDAKFEFLVPRRAPIRLENVPDDVCRGESNEWRVAAGLWDLYDSHPDGRDQASLDFERLWKPLRGRRMDSLASAWELIAPTLSPDQRRQAEASLSGNSLP